MKKYRLVAIDEGGKIRKGSWQDARNISVFTLNLNTGINNNLYKKWWYEFK